MSLSLKKFPTHSKENFDSPFQAIPIDKLNIPGAAMEVLSHSKNIIDAYPDDSTLYKDYYPKDIIIICKKSNLLTVNMEWDLDDIVINKQHMSFSQLLDCLAQGVLHLPLDTLLDKLLEAHDDKQAFGYWILHCLQFQYVYKAIQDDFNIDLPYLLNEMNHHNMLPSLKPKIKP